MFSSARLFLLGTLLSLSVNAFEHSPLELQVPILRSFKHKTHANVLTDVSTSYAEHNISVPVDHFHNESRYEPHSDDHFDLRYWFDASHYQEGGPVIVIAAGETNAENRFPFLSQGVVTQLLEEYHGIGVILEHRYYGNSYPVGNLTTESIRFLSTDQALADYAYFASNVVFPGLEHLDLTAKTTPYIGYGGSYAGAFVAFLRKLYPDVYWGSVSSSGVTAAVEDYWKYFEPIRQYGPSECISTIQTFTDILDKFLIDHKNKTVKSELKAAFGLKPKWDDGDDRWFVSIYSNGLSGYQGRNWDSQISDRTFSEYCQNITSTELVYPESTNAEVWIKKLLFGAGYDSSNATLVTNMLNYVGYFNATVFSQGPEALDDEEDANSSEIHGSPAPLSKSSSTSWEYQVCTEWGYFMTGSSVPADIRPLISRLIDMNYTTEICRTKFNITTSPDTDIINKHGGFNFSYPRVAIIDGLADPWRDATPHADGTAPRESTDDEPFILVDVPAEDVWDGIRGAVHHWDQNALSEKELAEGVTAPRVIIDLHQEIVRFVGVWLKQRKQTSHRVLHGPLRQHVLA
ncbi:hypothetical protein ASPWEDRAFT_531529 [Aspergillus wentii DTO 134E9]|uniref:Extracellular serine carboxypeptidase n=1 Tax=Aspergillus wentii DTO 134E9 TaxID=1073089 RepID=A0A1L9RLM9_ASPWE|nr:uncharacterized protein ASPWEDRAFT_531529 [Aspergillus wentii DTO 134E9]OJJ35850.1 hypothetical protein ASPWEDRAFT_531529 [Aspergillus wentii DTO 134E9]